MRNQPGETPDSLDFEHSPKKRSVFSQVKSLVTFQMDWGFVKAVDSFERNGNAHSYQHLKAQNAPDVVCQPPISNCSCMRTLCLDDIFHEI